MPQSPDQILTVAQMRGAEAALVAEGTSVDTLMQKAGHGAADWIWRLVGRGSVTVLCGPGNNGGDGYVIAEAIRQRGGQVLVIAAAEPTTAAARNARAQWRGEIRGAHSECTGDAFVDCLFGSGLTRPLSAGHQALLARLAASHRHRIAIDLPSGVQSDSGMQLNIGLPAYDLTLALGSWKFAHFLMPAAASMGLLRRVAIGIAPVAGSAGVLQKPKFSPPPADSHKYRRGLLAVVGGAMPGAALLAARAAQGAGAGYVKLFADADPVAVGADLVVQPDPLDKVLTDSRNSALLCGPGLGRDAAARDRLAVALADPAPVVLDADALILLQARQVDERKARTVATPHEGELSALERTFGCDGSGTWPERASTLARVSNMVIVAKGPDTVIAAPDGRVVCAIRATSWLSSAGSGDVLAGAIAGRLANGAHPFAAACQGVWLHGEAARLCPPPFTASELASAIRPAFAACL